MLTVQYNLWYETTPSFETIHILKPFPSYFLLTACLSDLLTVYTPSRQFCSSADTQILCISCVQTKSFGPCSFLYCAPKQWYSLHSDICHIQSNHPPAPHLPSTPQPYLQICVKNSPLQTMPQQSHFKLRLLDGLPVLSTTIFQLKLLCKQQVIVRNRSRRIGHDQAEYVFDDLECRTGNSDYTKIKKQTKE